MRIQARFRLALVLLASAALVWPLPATIRAAGTLPVAQPPDVRFVVGQALSAKRVPLRVSWPAATAGDAALERYELEARVDEDAWTPVALSSALSRSVKLRRLPGRLHQFRVRALDAAGQTSDWALGEPRWLAAVQEQDLEVGLAGTWLLRTPSWAFGDALTASWQAGATATLPFEAEQVAWVSTRGPDRGRAYVAVEGGPGSTVDLARSSVQRRRIVFAHRWDGTGEREIAVEVEGTTDRPRVDLDAFLTLGPPPVGILVGAGDIGSCGSAGDEATAQVLATVDGTVFTTGDNAYPDGTAANFANCYKPSWGPFKGRTRPSPGNHDYVTAGAAPYFAYFGPRAGPAGKGWFAYDLGTWRLYSLNSNCGAAGGCGTSSAQYAWLQADLAANPRRCVAAYWHHPRYSSGYHGGSARMRDVLDLLYANGADFVVAGHDHSYERFAPMSATGAADPATGIRHFVVGTGGAGLYAPGPTVMPNSEVMETKTHGVLKLTLSWSSYEWQFLPAGGGTFTDQGTTSCH